MREDLKLIANKMAAEASDHDYEATHKNGDKLLIEALQLMAEQYEVGTPSGDKIQAVVISIIDYWQAIGKWYA